MWPDGSSIAAPISTSLAEHRCRVHSKGGPPGRHSVSKHQSTKPRASCLLQASIARRSSRASEQAGCAESASCSWSHPVYTSAHDRHTAVASIRSTPQSPVMPQNGSLGHQCLPLDRRWQCRPSIQCISDAAGSQGGSSEAEHDGRSSGEYMQQKQASQPLLEVPWTAGKIFQVMFLWLLAFWALGYFALPNSLDLLGLERGDLSARGQALMHLLLDLGELGATLGILWRCLHAYQPLALGWFRARIRPLRSWLCPALLACAFFPLVDLAAARSQGWFPYDKELWGPNVLEQSLASGDMVSNAIYFVVVTICAPIWEEAIFRGFLLPSLTRYMPLTAAIGVSALSFAGAHFSLQRFLPLVLLGVIFGTLLVRTRNLLPCVLLHSLWNAYIFWQLTCRGTLAM